MNEEQAEKIIKLLEKINEGIFALIVASWFIMIFIALLKK